MIVNPPGLPEPSGYAHAVVAHGVIYLGGQIGEGETVVEQFDSAAAKIVVALRAAGGARAPRLDGGLHDRDGGVPGIARRARQVWRRHFGRRYPAIALVGGSALLDPDAKVELMGVAVLER